MSISLRTAFLMALCLPFPGRAGWEMTGGPQGGRIHALLADGSTLYAGLMWNGIFRSADGGTTWTRPDAGLSDYRIYALCQSEGRIFAASVPGVFRSADNGASWSLLPNSPFLPIGLVAAGGRLYGIGEQGRIYISPDGGAAWREIAGGPAFKAAGLAARGDTLIVGSRNGYVFRSLDEGATWDSVFVAKVSASGFRSIGSLLIADGFWCAGSESGAIYRSVDLGMSWTQSTVATGTNRPIRHLIQSENLAFAFTSNGCLRSSDGGSNWTEHATGTWQFSATAVAKADGRLYVGNEFDLLRSSDGLSSLARLNGGIGNVKTVALAAFGRYLFAGHENGSINRSEDRGDHWTALDISLPFDGLHRFRVRADTIYAVTDGNGIFRSADAGATWDSINTGLRYPGRQFILSRDLAFLDGNLFAGTHVFGVYRSSDNGRQWNQVVNGFHYAPDVDALLAYGPYLLAGADKQGVYRTADLGAHWTPMNAGMALSGSDSDHVYALAASGPYVLAATGRGIFRSSDSASTWSPSNRGLAVASGSLPRIRSMETQGSHVFVSTDTGVYHSANHGGDWSRIDQGMNDSGYTCLAMDGNYLYTGTSSVAVSTSQFDRGAVWRRALAELEVQTAVEPGPGKRSIPTANGTGARVLVAPGIVELSLERPAVIGLSLHDIAGRRTASLLQGHFPPGRYRATLPGAAEGLRILRLKLEGSESRSVLLRP